MKLVKLARWKTIYWLQGICSTYLTFTSEPRSSLTGLLFFWGDLLNDWLIFALKWSQVEIKKDAVSNTFVVLIFINQLPIDSWGDPVFWRVLVAVEIRSKARPYNRKDFSMPAPNWHARYSSDFCLKAVYATKSANLDSWSVRVIVRLMASSLISSLHSYWPLPPLFPDCLHSRPWWSMTVRRSSLRSVSMSSKKMWNCFVFLF